MTTLLALDTSAQVGSVALARDGRTIARAYLTERNAHAAAIVPAIDALLAETELERAALDAVVVGSGPGSFTGVRIAAATAKGLVRGLRRPLFALSSLAAGAVADTVFDWSARPWAPSPDLEPPAPHEAAGAPRYVLFDARGTRVYAACYREAAGRLETLVPPVATTLEAILAGGDLPDDAFFAGEGALRHRGAIREAGHRVLPAPAGMPTAEGLLHLLGLEGEQHPIDDVGAWQPDYLREWTHR